MIKATEAAHLLILAVGIVTLCVRRRWEGRPRMFFCFRLLLFLLLIPMRQVQWVSEGGAFCAAELRSTILFGFLVLFVFLVFLRF